MSLELGTRNDLVSALHDTFTPLLFEQMLLNRLHRRQYDIILDGGNYLAVLEAVVDTANHQDWLYFLIKAAVEDQPLAPHLASFLKKYPDLDPAAGPAPITDHVMAHVLHGRRYFIDRKELRLALKDMRSDLPSTRLLVVNGERFTGKTWTRELISFLSEMTPKHRAVYVDLDKDVYEALTLTKAIGQLMGMDITTIPKQEDEQKARWTQNLCGWIIAKINSGDITYWFVFDGVRERTLLPETKDWIDELAVQVESNRNVPRSRVVLLDYKESLPFGISDYAGREEIKPIGRDELIDFFELMNRDYKQKYASEDLKGNIDVLMAEVDTVIATAMAQADIAAKPEIEAKRPLVLSKAVNETVRLLFV